MSRHRRQQLKRARQELEVTAFAHLWFMARLFGRWPVLDIMPIDGRMVRVTDMRKGFAALCRRMRWAETRKPTDDTTQSITVPGPGKPGHQIDGASEKDAGSGADGGLP